MTPFGPFSSQPGSSGADGFTTISRFAQACPGRLGEPSGRACVEEALANGWGLFCAMDTEIGYESEPKYHLLG